jgi:SNF2 family DNA or RNA helicase
MMRRKPHGYQIRAEDFLFDNPESGAFLEPGLGKTGISLALIKRLKTQGGFRGALVVAPLRPCYLVWPKEMRKWQDFKGLSYTILHGKDKDTDYLKDRDVYIINPEGLDWLLDKLYGVRRDKWPFNVLIVDESTKFKHPGSLRSRNLKTIARKIERKHLLTGTPAPNGLKDLFGQYLIMDEGKTFGTTKSDFEKRYFYKSGYMGKELKPLPRGQREIYSAMEDTAITMRAEDYLELPELIINKVEIELPPKAREYYNKIEKELLLKFKDGKVTAANAGVLSSKCRQIACGGVYLDDEERTWKNLHTGKTEACFDLVEELQGNPALLAYEFRHDLDRLEKTFKGGIPTIRSRMSMSRTQRIEADWNRGEIPLLFGQHTTIALGLNLQGAGNTIIVHTVPWSYETWYQLIRRIYRQGQKNKRVVVHALIAKKTVEEVVWQSLTEDEGTHHSLFQVLGTYIDQI